VAAGDCISDGQVLASGTDADIRARADARTKVVGLAAATVMPGLMDSTSTAARRPSPMRSGELDRGAEPRQGLDVIARPRAPQSPAPEIKIGGAG